MPIVGCVTDVYYKVCHVLKSVTHCYIKECQVLQSVTVITKRNVTGVIHTEKIVDTFSLSNGIYLETTVKKYLP